MTHATGTFDVQLKPIPTHDTALGSPLGSMSIDKQIHGDLEATTVGEMLMSMGTVKGSAGYVAMEHVRGTLHGKAGSFVFQHGATMNRGVPTLSVTVVPDSGTGELKGLAGTFDIIIEAGNHSYTFDYTLDAGA
ncbi:MAG: hypothetical protein JWM95_4500 [Gemmatimonadetes bacterium]|nr:hypothetical protein [Gemmatimonadota bacterium]